MKDVMKEANSKVGRQSLVLVQQSLDGIVHVKPASFQWLATTNPSS